MDLHIPTVVWTFTVAFFVGFGFGAFFLYALIKDGALQLTCTLSDGPRAGDAPDSSS